MSGGRASGHGVLATVAAGAVAYSRSQRAASAAGNACEAGITWTTMPTS